MNTATIAKSVCVLAAALALAACASGPAGTAKKESDPQELLAAFEGLEPAEIVRAGDAAAAQGEAERALFIYNQALMLEASADTWYRVGHVYWEMGKEPEAWRAYANALQLDPEHAPSHEELGLLHMAMKQQEPAETHLRRAVELSSSSWRAHNALGVLADVRKDYVSAISHYNAALEVNPESAMLLNNLGYSHYLAGNYGEAEAILRMAVGIDRSYEPAVANLGLSHARRGDYAEAVEILRQVMPVSQAYNDVGFVAYHNGDLEDAAWLLTEAIRLSPTYYEVARKNLRRVRDAMAGHSAQTARGEGSTANDGVVRGSRLDTRRVRAGVLNVRAAAHREAPVVVQIRQGKAVEAVYELNGWAFVEFWSDDEDGRQAGWVKAEYLEAEGPAASGAAETAPENETSAAVTTP